VLPLRLYEAGAELLPVCVAWKPTVIDAFGAMSPLYWTFLAVTCPELGE
jgi:hypothetical protein